MKEFQTFEDAALDASVAYPVKMSGDAVLCAHFPGFN